MSAVREEVVEVDTQVAHLVSVCAVVAPVAVTGAPVASGPSAHVSHETQVLGTRGVGPDSTRLLHPSPSGIRLGGHGTSPVALCRCW